MKPDEIESNVKMNSVRCAVEAAPRMGALILHVKEQGELCWGSC